MFISRKWDQRYGEKKGYCSMSPLVPLGVRRKKHRKIFKACGTSLNYQRFLQMLPWRTTCPKRKTALQWLEEKAKGERDPMLITGFDMWSPISMSSTKPNILQLKDFVGQTQITSTHMVWRANFSFSYLNTTLL